MAKLEVTFAFNVSKSFYDYIDCIRSSKYCRIKYLENNQKWGNRVNR